MMSNPVERKRIIAELKQLKVFEGEMIDLIGNPYLPHEDLKLVTEKLFEVCEYIIKLETYLKNNT